VELPRSKFQHGVAMRLRHGENEIGIRGNFRRELSRGEAFCVTTELLEDEGRSVFNRMSDHRAGAGAGCPEVRHLRPSGPCDGESLRGWRPADVSSAYKQYVQSTLLMSNGEPYAARYGMYTGRHPDRSEFARTKVSGRARVSEGLDRNAFAGVRVKLARCRMPAANRSSPLGRHRGRR
jgi:hypothetical protein